jgi:hypothetical protein
MTCHQYPFSSLCDDQASFGHQEMNLFPALRISEITEVHLITSHNLQIY